jgi:hypothetical protein
MRNLKASMMAVALGLTALTTGCATVTGGTSQNVTVKTQKQSTDVAGADCVLTNSKGTYKVVTPATVAVHRAKDDLSVNCTKDGETTASTAVKSSMRTGAIVGDIAWLGVLSVVSYGVDRANGSVFAYPDNITVSFDAPAPAPAADVPAAASSTSADGAPAQAAPSVSASNQPTVVK